jgi:hypothetical protein
MNDIHPTSADRAAMRSLQQQQQQQQQRHGCLSNLDAVVDVAPASFFKDNGGLDTLADVSVRPLPARELAICWLDRPAVDRLFVLSTWYATVTIARWGGGGKVACTHASLRLCGTLS